MKLEVVLLGLVSGLRPGTSLAAVLALLRTPQPQRPLLFFTIAGFTWSWVIGMVVVGVFHGANVAVGASTFTAVFDIAFGAAALGFAVGLHRGWVQPTRGRGTGPSTRGAPARLGRRLRDPSARVAAVAGVVTHAPGLVYLAALNAIASERPAPVDVAVEVATYDVLWLLIPLTSFVLVMLRPGTALAYLDAATAWVRRHEHAVLVTGSLVLGGYLVVKGTASLLA